jgi:hypothetical protein
MKANVRDAHRAAWPKRMTPCKVVTDAIRVGQLATDRRDVRRSSQRASSPGAIAPTCTDVDMSVQPGLFSLLPQVIDAVRVPVVAVRGVANGRTAAAGLNA